jgi:drug/metabolite transporter (DMT)-like permease
MLSGVAFLSEPLSARFAFTAALIAAAIALVNLR